jgi:Ring finger domain/RWD domain
LLVFSRINVLAWICVLLFADALKTVQITCNARTAGDSGKSYCSAQLQIQLPACYPVQRPQCRITQTACLSDENTRELHSSMQALLDELYAEERLEGCCYQLIDCIIETLDSMNAQGECAICLMPLFSDNSNADAAVRTACFHIFCNSCLANWWRRHEAAQQQSRTDDTVSTQSFSIT